MASSELTKGVCSMPSWSYFFLRGFLSISTSNCEALQIYKVQGRASSQVHPFEIYHNLRPSSKSHGWHAQLATCICLPKIFATCQFFYWQLIVYGRGHDQPELNITSWLTLEKFPHFTSDLVKLELSCHLVAISLVHNIQFRSGVKLWTSL